jgi:DNA-binding NtrC family response regulator
MANDRVLVVENEASIRTTLRQFLESSRYDVWEATTCADAKRLWRVAHPDIAIVDYSLPDGNALDLLDVFRGIDSWAPVVILASHGSMESAMAAVQGGAEQFLAKPVELPVLGLVLQRILDEQRNHRRQLAESAHESRNPLNPFVGTSPAVHRLAEMARQLAANDVPVLIQGEPGTGKRILARWIHQNGPRASQPFVDLNCGGLSRDLQENELFGNKRGAFSGSSQSTTGLLEIAHKGTVFLDEIGCLDSQVQPKLVKLISTGQFVRVGDVLDRRVDIRLISATRHDLEAPMRQGQFRDDLYFRISSFTLIVPPLRERAEDIPQVVDHLLTGLAQEIGTGPREVSAEFMRTLQSHPWPGNLRELRNVLERALLLSANRVITERDLHLEARRDIPVVGNTPDKTLDQVERQYIQAVLNQEGGRVEVAAKKLGIPRSSLYYKLKQYGLRRTGTTMSQHI